MERLSIAPEHPYSPIEGSIHVGRYAPILPFCRGRRVLDVACGEGYGSWLISQAGASLVQGVDISADAVATAKRNFQADNLKFECCNAEKLSKRFQDAKFDLIVCIETIEHVKNPKLFLGELKKLATADCLILITCPNDHWYYQDQESNPYHVRKYTFAEFQALTQAELGDHVRWYVGTAAQGFVTVPVGVSGGSSVNGAKASIPTRYVAIDRLHSTLLCLPKEEDRIDEVTCSYFVGVWNLRDTDFGGGAFFPMSMTAYAQREARPKSGRSAIRAAALLELKAQRAKGGDVSDLKLQNTALATSLIELQERFTSDLERRDAELRSLRDAKPAELRNLHRNVANLQGLVADLEERLEVCHADSVQLAEQVVSLRARTAELDNDARAYRVQAAALRRENDVLAESVQRLRGEKDMLGAEHAQRLVAIREEEGRAAREQKDTELHALGEIKDQEIAALREDAERLAAENAAMSASLTFWRERKAKIVGMIPSVLRPPMRWAYRQIAQRRRGGGNSGAGA